MTFLPVKITGIPALVDVHKAEYHKGSFRADAPSDLDYHGYWELDYTICDRRGRPAPWLEEKLSPKEKEEIEELIRESQGEEV